MATRIIHPDCKSYWWIVDVRWFGCQLPTHDTNGLICWETLSRFCDLDDFLISEKILVDFGMRCESGTMAVTDSEIQLDLCEGSIRYPKLKVSFDLELIKRSFSANLCSDGFINGDVDGFAVGGQRSPRRS